jgi:AraC-like DNA-binding protein
MSAVTNTALALPALPPSLTYLPGLHLVLQSFRADQRLLPPAWRNPEAWPEYGQGAHASRHLKDDLLEHALAVAGPRALLRLGEGLGDLDVIPFAAALSRCPGAAALAESWARLEALMQIEPRTVFERVDARVLAFSRRDAGGGPPPLRHHLFVAGALWTLLGHQGHQDLTLEVTDSDGHSWAVAGGPDRAIRGPLPEARRARRWTLYAHERSPSTGQEPPGGEGPRELPWPTRVCRQLSFDERPSLKQLARRLGTSSRTLQRRLAEQGLRFQTLTRTNRVHEAARRLLDTEQPITQVAMDTGFSDSAHLTREFRRVTGVTPSGFRWLSAPTRSLRPSHALAAAIPDRGLAPPFNEPLDRPASLSGDPATPARPWSMFRPANNDGSPCPNR